MNTYDRWYTRHRQEWIAETLRVFGYIDRKHLMRKFEISEPQAALDLRRYQQQHPAAITYNRNTKRYEPARAEPETM